MRARPRPARRVGLVVAAVVLLLVACAAWLVVRVTQVADDLRQARGHLADVDLAFDQGSLDGVGRQLEAAGRETASARSRAGDPLWRAAERLPVVGDDLSAVRVVATAADTVVREVAPPALEAAGSIDTDNVRADDGRLDLDAVVAVRPALDAAGSAGTAARSAVQDVDRGGLTGPVAEAVDEVSAQLDEVVPAVEGLARAARLLPPMLGGEGPRRYFLAFQNPAESRGTGGIVGVFGVLEVEDGRVELVSTGVNNDLETLAEPPVDHGEEYRSLYGDLTTDSDNANLSPHFPYMAQNLLALWEQQSGERLDGLVSVDPVALQHLLRGTGPLELPFGERVSPNGLVDLTLSEVYARFEDQDARRDYLSGLIAAAFDRLSGPGSDPVALARALRAPVAEHRVLVYSAHEAEQRDLDGTALSGALPPSEGLLRGVVVNNAGANKLDYYLDRTVRYEVGCEQDGRSPTTLRAVLRNDAPPSGLPRYVTSHTPDLEAAPATNRLIVSAYLPAPTGMLRVLVDGVPTGAQVGAELGYDVFSVMVDVPAGEAREVEWQLDEPAVATGARLLEQPLVREADQSLLRTPGCDTQ